MKQFMHQLTHDVSRMLFRSTARLEPCLLHCQAVGDRRTARQLVPPATARKESSANQCRIRAARRRAILLRPDTSTGDHASCTRHHRQCWRRVVAQRFSPGSGWCSGQVVNTRHWRTCRQQWWQAVTRQPHQLRCQIVHSMQRAM